MNSELSSSVLPALPVRKRETLEILDTALKLYRRYFWVLIGWSALVSALALVPVLNWVSFLAMPLLYGAVSCCVAAAVRGQGVKFSQCWAFSKPRYGPLLGTMLLSYLILFAVIMALSLAGVLVFLLGAWALSNAPQPVQIIGIILGFLLGLAVFSVLGVVAFGWTNMVPIVVCLEDDKRSTAAIGRAFDLLKGNWRRVFGLSLILGLAAIMVFTLVSVVFALLGLGRLSGLADPTSDAFIGLVTSFTVFVGLFTLAWYPAQTLIVAVLYLDLRVRREALDLEWTAYASAPAPTPHSSLAPPEIQLSSGVSLAPLPTNNDASTPASFAAGKAENVSESASGGEIPAPNQLSSSENEARRD